MRIVIDARESGTTTGRYIDKLLEYLHGLEFSHEIIVLAKRHRFEILKQLEPRFKVIESNFKEFTFAEQWGLRKQIISIRPDLVHFGAAHQPILYRGRKVTTIHDLTTTRFVNPVKNKLVYKFKQFVYKIVIHSVSRKSKIIIVPSNFVKRDVAQFCKIKQSKIVVSYEAADKIMAPAEPLKGIKPRSFIMYTGRPLPHKNLERLIEAFKILKDAHPSLQLVLAGKDHPLYNALKRKVKAEDIKDVHFTGFVSEGQLRWLYETTSAYVFPSLSEGFGLPGLEAMVHGAPVVSSHMSSLPEIYGPAAHYFDPYDINDIAIRVNDVLTTFALREKLIRVGYRQAKKYSWANMAQQTLDVYDKALG